MAHSKRRLDAMRFGSIFLIVIGVSLMVLSPLWYQIASSKLFWDEAAVQEFTAAAADLHHSTSEAALDPAKIRHAKAAQKRFKDSQIKFERARQFRERGGTIMRITGGIVAFIGVCLYMASRPMD